MRWARFALSTLSAEDGAVVAVCAAAGLTNLAVKQPWGSARRRKRKPHTARKVRKVRRLAATSAARRARIRQMLKSAEHAANIVNERADRAGGKAAADERQQERVVGAHQRIVVDVGQVMREVRHGYCCWSCRR